MKKNILIFCFLSVCLFAFSQSDTTDYFVFMDTPITGSVKSFASKLEKKGFKPVVVESNAGKMTGMFTQKDVEVYILPTPKTNIVYAVSVVFQDKNTWLSLKSDYLSLKDALSNKYGKPSITRESFSRPYYEGDGYEMTAVRTENVTFFSRWIKENGEIVLSISDGHIQMFYVDRSNSAIQKIEEGEIINSDL